MGAPSTNDEEDAGYTRQAVGSIAEAGSTAELTPAANVELTEHRNNRIRLPIRRNHWGLGHFGTGQFSLGRMAQNNHWPSSRLRGDTWVYENSDQGDDAAGEVRSFLQELRTTAGDPEEFRKLLLRLRAAS